jgi:hypothetical protein
MKVTTMNRFAFVLPLLLAFTIAAQDFPRTTLGGRSVEMRLVKPEDLSPIAWPKGHAELTQTTTSLEGTNVLLKLKANGIAPDSEALTLVYDLNPSIYDLNSLPPNTQIQLPSVETVDPEFKKLLHDGCLVELTVDPDIRRELNSRIETLQGLAPQITAANTDVATSKQLKQTIEWFQEVEKRFKRRTGPPLRRSTLDQLNEEAGQVTTLLQGALQQNRSINDDEKQQISAIFGDMQTVMKEYGQSFAGSVSPGEPQYLVTVTIKGTNPALIAGLRVYFTFNGLFRSLPANPPIKASGFTELGSGKSHNFQAKNYQVWAARDGDPNDPVTPPYPLNIDETSKSPISVELSLVHKP